MLREFQLFNLPAQFDLDPAALEQTYRQLAARFHPDKTATASAFEQKQAVMMAAAVNEAYRRLSRRWNAPFCCCRRKAFRPIPKSAPPSIPSF